MSHITFTDGVTVIPAAWLNDVDTVVYTYFGNGTSLNSPTKLTIGSVITSLVGTATGADLNFQVAGAVQWAILNSGGHLFPVTHNSRDIGGSSQAARTGYFGTSVVTPLVGTDTNTTLFFKTNGANIWSMNSSGTLAPVGDNTQQLGVSTNRISQVVTPIIDSGTASTLEFRTNNGTRQALISHAANAVNYTFTQGGATGAPVVFVASSQTDANVTLIVGSRGTGSINFATNTNNTFQPQFQVADTNNAANNYQVFGGVSGSPPGFYAAGADTNVGSDYSTKGTGKHRFLTGGGAVVGLEILHTASGSRNVTVTSSNGGNPTISTTAGNLQVGTVLDLGSTGQIQFPAAQNASAGANVLDDYEEGTWVPTLGGSATYTTQTGEYTKIGRLVFIRGTITVNTIGTGATSTISGLPFTCAANTGISLSRIVSSVTAIVSATCRADAGATTLSLLSRTAASASDAGNAIFQNATSVDFSGCYQV